jgi:hypothetical protein
MSKKHRYRFGIAYLHRRPIQFSVLYGWWCTDGYDRWLINLSGSEQA